MGYTFLYHSCVCLKFNRDQLKDIYFSLRGLLLIIAILLVGTGFTFIKHVLSERERKLFIIAIPLQVIRRRLFSIIVSLSV